MEKELEEFSFARGKRAAQCRECRKKHYDENKEIILKQKKEYYEKNKEKKLQKAKEYYHKRKNEQEFKERKSKNGKKSYQKTKERKRRYERNRDKNDERFSVIKKLRHRLWLAFRDYSTKGKCKRSNEYGINYQAIFEHLGPCPGNRSEYHIDHIKPLCLFDFNDNIQVRKAFAPENHRWLTAEENLKKGNKF